MKNITTRKGPPDKEVKELEAQIKDIWEKRCKGNEGIIAQFEDFLHKLGEIYLRVYLSWRESKWSLRFKIFQAFSRYYGSS